MGIRIRLELKNKIRDLALFNLAFERKDHLADSTIKKDKRINIRISNRDLTAIQRRAVEEGMPYQTLIAKILHKYVSCGLVDVLANKYLKLENLKFKNLDTPNIRSIGG